MACFTEPPPATSIRQRLVAGTIGLCGSVIGAGGGVFLVPYLARSGFQMRRAVATSTAVGFPVTIVGTLFYAFVSPPAGLPHMLGKIYFPALLGFGLGSMLGAPLGAKLASEIDGDKLRRAFGVLLIILAVNVAF